MKKEIYRNEYYILYDDDTYEYTENYFDSPFDENKILRAYHQMRKQIFKKKTEKQNG